MHIIIKIMGMTYKTKAACLFSSEIYTPRLPYICRVSYITNIFILLKMYFIQKKTNKSDICLIFFYKINIIRVVFMNPHLYRSSGKGTEKSADVSIAPGKERGHAFFWSRIAFCHQLYICIRALTPQQLK